MTWGVDCWAVDWAERDGVGKGLFINTWLHVSYWRHHSLDRRSIGRWEVYASSPESARLIFGTEDWRIRPAVVDDFGNLVIVGALQ